jgi:hypothetical protein
MFESRNVSSIAAYARSAHALCTVHRAAHLRALTVRRRHHVPAVVPAPEVVLQARAEERGDRLVLLELRARAVAGLVCADGFGERGLAERRERQVLRRLVLCQPTLYPIK